MREVLGEALARDFKNIPDVEELGYAYTFSDSFQRGMEDIISRADRKYVSVGRHRIRRAVATGLIAVMLMAAAAGTAAIRRPIIHWLTQDNKADGALDISFEVDDPEGLTKQFTYIKPSVPKEYKIISEEKFEDIQYSILYENEEGLEICYMQSGDIEGMALGLDNESGNLRETEINGYRGYAYSASGSHTLIWSNGIYLFNLSGTCSMDVIREIAEKIN